MKRLVIISIGLLVLLGLIVFFVKLDNNEILTNKRTYSEEDGSYDDIKSKEEWEEIDAQNEARIREEKEQLATEQEQYMAEWEAKSREKCIKVEQEKNPTTSLTELEGAIEKCIVEVMNGTYEW